MGYQRRVHGAQGRKSTWVSMRSSIDSIHSPIPDQRKHVSFACKIQFDDGQFTFDGSTNWDMIDVYAASPKCSGNSAEFSAIPSVPNKPLPQRPEKNDEATKSFTSLGSSDLEMDLM